MAMLYLYGRGKESLHSLGNSAGGLWGCNREARSGDYEGLFKNVSRIIAA